MQFIFIDEILLINKRIFEFEKRSIALKNNKLFMCNCSMEPASIKNGTRKN
jgi:hypothetical protein